MRPTETSPFSLTACLPVKLDITLAACCKEFLVCYAKIFNLTGRGLEFITHI